MGGGKQEDSKRNTAHARYISLPLLLFGGRGNLHIANKPSCTPDKDGWFFLPLHKHVSHLSPLFLFFVFFCFFVFLFFVFCFFFFFAV